VKFLIDASSDARLAGHLHSLGHDVTRVGRDYPHDLEDTAILALAVHEDRVVITDDRDFGELIFLHRQEHLGVIYFRLVASDLAVRIARLDAVLTVCVDRLDGFIVVGSDDIKVASGP